MTSPLLAFNPKGQAFAEETSTKYCQLIREANQVKRLEFSEQCLWENEQFDNVIFTDECSVYVMENHGKITLANFPSQSVLPIVVARQGKASGKELPNPQNGS